LKICSNESIETEAEGILVRYVDQDFSYADAVSFVIMKRQKIRKAFSFDKHFVTAGFINIP
jgi:predicted nucleic acid-binding protein